jgi:hypothetical protein
MLMRNNPFTSKTFVSKWVKHFYSGRSPVEINFINGLTFFKAKTLNLFINTGRNLTKGISYSLTIPKIINFKKSIILIYDVPAYFQLDIGSLPEKVTFHKIKQYPGYLVELHKYKDLNDYFQKTFSKKTNDKLKRYQRRLELCFDIKYKMFHGDISKEEYDFIFDCFKILLEKRFTVKQTTNNNLNSEEWEFYHDVAFPMILEKKASLFVVYEDSNPIAVTLNYFSENTLFHAITTFDIDYSKFHLGKIAMANLFFWCFEQNLKFFDFSKGHFDYKTHWMTKKYDFEYHLYYDNSSIKSKLIGIIIKNLFELKQYLREKELHKKLHELTYRFKKHDHDIKTSSSFDISGLTKEYKDFELLEIDLFHKDFIPFKSVVNEFLFLNSESLYSLKIMKVLNTQSTYLFKGEKTSQKIVIS